MTCDICITLTEKYCELCITLINSQSLVHTIPKNSKSVLLNSQPIAYQKKKKNSQPINIFNWL